MTVQKHSEEKKSAFYLIPPDLVEKIERHAANRERGGFQALCSALSACRISSMGEAVDAHARADRLLGGLGVNEGAKSRAEYHRGFMDGIKASANMLHALLAAEEAEGA